MNEEFYIPEDEVTFFMKMIRFYFHRVGWLAPNFTVKLFWKLFTNPRERDLNKGHQSFMELAESRSFQSDFYGATYTIHKYGVGKKKVLLCHGWEGRTVDFRRLIEALTLDEELQVISIDFPGHGSSPKSQAHLPMFVDVIDSYFKIDRDVEVVIGHSMGAASIAMAVPKQPDFFRDKKLILMGLHPIPSNFIIQYKSVTKIGDKLFDKCMKLAEGQLRQPLTEYDCHNYVDLYALNEVLLIHDSEDTIINLKRVEQLHVEIQNSKLFSGNHGGHFKHYRHHEVITEIKDFI